WASVARPPEQLAAAPQALPAGFLRQAPLPSQKPSMPHSLASVGQPPVPLGAWPSSIERQVPRFVGLLHAWQAPPQAVAQQTPSAQMPLWQSPLVAHEPPSDFLPLPQVPEVQAWPAAHWSAARVQ